MSYEIKPKHVIVGYMGTNILFIVSPDCHKTTLSASVFICLPVFLHNSLYDE